MFEVRGRLSREEFETVENLIFETEGMEQWNLYENFDDKGYWVQGVFETLAEAKVGESAFGSWISIEAELVVKKIQDVDWKESYKDHFKPWSIDTLHWAPRWLKDEYLLPEGEQVVWLDPGMAFGTGNHGTTRLCVEQLVAFKNSGRDLGTARLMDAGCGSGILAISAGKLGFEQVEGFDIDPDAIRIAEENAELNGLTNIQFSTGGLEKHLTRKGSDCLLANILANVLVANAQLLIDAVAPGGWLILSGILATEANSVVDRFESKEDWSSVKTNTMDEWASISLVKRG